MRSRIAAVGSYLPPQVVTSVEIEEGLGTSASPGWLEELTGVGTRRFGENGVTSSSLAISALRDMMSRSKRSFDEIDCLIVGSVSADFLEPATANVIQEALGLSGSGFDVNNACNGFLTSVQLGDSLIRTGAYRCVAIVCGEMASPFIPWHLARGTDIPMDHLGALTLGDGGGAVLLVESPDERGISAMRFMTDPQRWRAATVLGGGSMYPHDPEKHYFMSSPGVLFEAAQRYVPDLVDETLDAAGWTRNDVELIVGHQVSLTMTRKLTDLFGKGTGLAIDTYSEFGNNAAASIPIALDVARQTGRLHAGTKLLFVACAAGFAAGVAAVRW